MARAKSRSRNPAANLLLVLLLVVLGGAATIGTLVVLGKLDLSAFGIVSAKEKREQEIDRTGKVAVVIATRPIPRFTRVTQAHLVDPKSGTLKLAWVDEDNAKKNGFLQKNDILGRVMARAKLVGYPFVESEFLPQGAQDNWTSGVPAGMRGLTFDVERIAGIATLKEGDRFDLMAVHAPKAKSSSPAPKGTYLAPGVTASQKELEGWLSTSQIVVRGAEVIVAAPPPPAPGAPRAAQKGPREVHVAVPEDEVTTLMRVLPLDVEVTAIVSSGRPDVDEKALVQPPPPTPSKTIQILSGVDSKDAVVPAPDVDEDEDAGADEETAQETPPRKKGAVH